MNRFRRISLELKTLLSLGMLNVLRVLCYRLLVKRGYYKNALPMSRFENTATDYVVGSWHKADVANVCQTLIEQATDITKGRLRYFFYHTHDVGTPPNWFVDPFNDCEFTSGDTHWSCLGDYAQNDIKICWELSRFDWALVLARAYQAGGDTKYLDTFNRYIADWCKQNSPNTGINWKCGQETAIRVNNVLLAAFIFADDNIKHPSKALIEFVISHCKRIDKTLFYALAQENNHATSEAAALFICGCWLSKYSLSDEHQKLGKQWHGKGRHWLEKLTRSLIYTDGSFSQNSTNYHRVMLNTLSVVEFWRNYFNDNAFTAAFYDRAKSATRWLFNLTDPKTGDVPNVGGNDGALIYHLADTDYRDYRPAVALAVAIFEHKRLYGLIDEPWLDVLGISVSHESKLKPVQQSWHGKKGGYVNLKNSADTSVFLKYPNYQHRPAHADCMHCEVWQDGQPIVCDSGSYSYNTSNDLLSYFGSAKAHNTVQFGTDEPMLKKSRYLWLGWPKAKHVSFSGDKKSWSGGFFDVRKRWHHRKVSLAADRCIIEDQVEGKETAVLRWHLNPDVEWYLSDDGTRCTSSLASITIEVSSKRQKMHFEDGWISRYYLQKLKSNVLSVEVAPSVRRVKTTIIPTLKTELL